MKEKAPVIIMLATTLGLGILLVVQHNSAKSREKAATTMHQKQVKEFERRVVSLAENLRGNEKELSDQVNEVSSLGAKLASSEAKAADTSKELENTTNARDKALEDLAQKDAALEQNQQELLDTKANVAAVETKLGDKTGELEQVKTELVANKKELLKKGDKLAKVAEELGAATAEIAQSKDELEKKTKALVAALKELEDGQARIAKLEADLQIVNQQVGGLKTQIGSLEEGIETTQNKLAAAEGDRAFLLRELKRMQDEKAELEKHLNNLEYVREQYNKLKSEWVASERLRRIRDGIGYYGYKNGNVKGVASLAKLARRGQKPSKSTPSTNINENELNVELKNDGTVIIAEPGKTLREVLPGESSPKFIKPSGKGESQSTQTKKPKGVVTPAQEPAVLPSLETEPVTPPASKPESK